MARKPFYTVKKGDSFFSIAGKLFGNQRAALELRRFLRITNLHPGMRLDLRGFKPSSNPFIGAAAAKEFGFSTQYDESGNAIPVSEGAATTEFADPLQELPEDVTSDAVLSATPGTPQSRLARESFIGKPGTDLPEPEDQRI